VRKAEKNLRRKILGDSENLLIVVGGRETGPGGDIA
jgi:hypothetical protein